MSLEEIQSKIDAGIPYVVRLKSDGNTDEPAHISVEDGIRGELSMPENTQDTVMTPDVYKKTFWRTFPLQACFCFERMQNVGFAYMMVPALKKLYTDKKDISDALKRHLAIFNTTPAVVSFIAGASIAMEEKFKKAKDNGEEVDDESINAVKTALMGPLAGIGDSFIWGTLRIIATGVGLSLANQGNILGPILFLLIFNLPAKPLRN